MTRIDPFQFFEQHIFQLIVLIARVKLMIEKTK